ncbi:type IV pilus secretin PilQ [Bermanella sp. WJH001]|uniref:type IV pilus secretin PilQ n=1 Tax=Bermanella sp. WJH001 TaxID=3048005 RepID=UPI0024BDA38B|nr:type IV pilus secretin PilQ family protein [Bermanella sp. WJH001]MDJ1539033.1 type IV pilus secretin PilQ family protein [Bermanella sp. WJH001]
MKKNIMKNSLIVLLCLVSSSLYAATIKDVAFASLPGDKTEMKLTFDGLPPDVSGYTIEEPARIALDLPNTISELKSKYHKIGMGNARTAIIVGTQEKTRVIINLTELTGYETRIEGNDLFVVIGQQERIEEEDVNILAAQDAPTYQAKKKDESGRIIDVDFRRGDLGEGQVLISLSNPNVPVDISQESGRIRVEFGNVNLSEEMRRRLDVRDFATPVRFIDATIESGKPVFFIEPNNDRYEYLAYQADNLLTINVKPLTKAEEERLKEERFPYTGEKLSLNFQDIEVRTVLQIIADFTGFNLVASDTVQGSITLRLKNVPWDQALDIVLKSQGLAKQQIGNVLMVGPADQIANRQKIELEANRQVEDFAPLRTEFIQVRYAKATDLLALISAEGSLLGERGSASVDVRTNTIILQDTASSIEAVRKAIKVLDVPVRQVLIEARIVVASTNVGENLGIRWGGGYGVLQNDQIITAGGTGVSTSDFNASTSRISVTDGSIVNLPVNSANATTFGIGLDAFDYMLDLELSAMESDGKAEIISQPRVITADGQTAKIQAGSQIPYEQASASGATTIVFKDAVLKLEVTPQITPDDRILMDLLINKDAIGEVINNIPTIDTNALETQVLVNNGETIVLGGIFQSEDVTQIDKTPFFGDLPVIGRLFRRTTHTEDKSELLIFITPRLVKDVLSTR